jgi:WD40 repeat protein
MFASASSDAIRIWSPSTAAQRTVINGGGDVWAIAFDPAGRSLASASVDGKLNLWDPSTGTKLAEFHGQTQSLISLAFSPDGATLATGNLLWKIQLWDVATTKQRDRYEGHSAPVCSLAFSPNGNSLASADWGESLLMRPEAKIWDIRTRHVIASFRGHNAGLTAVSFSPNGRLLATAARDGTVVLWNVSKDAGH